jgi:hypothetical protein
MAQPVWIIDTSSIIAVRRLPVDSYKKAAIFRRMGALVEANRLVFPKEAVKELERFADPNSPDEQYEWAARYEWEACKNEPSLEEVRDVLAKVPKVLDPDKDTGADEADPYVLAMALRLRNEGEDARVVTQERRETPAKMSLGTAAGLLGLPAVPLEAFLEYEGIDC